MLDPTPEHLSIARQMRAKARRGWVDGTLATLERFQAKRWVTAITAPELTVCLLLTRDRMHHGSGWWRNAEYEYCWHLSLSARDRLAIAAQQDTGYEDLPRAEVEYWARLVFEENARMLWHEPGGGDPRLTPDEQRTNAAIWHLRLFLDPDTMEPFMPTGEVYTLTRWVDGLTPEKVDR